MNGLVVCVLGPTASGKSGLGVALAQRLGGEVISADSMQIYRGMDIGTAKLTTAEMRGIPHHLLDVADPDESYSVARWAEAARAAIDGILAAGGVPIVVGGTGLYLKAITDDLDFAQHAGEPAIRREWEMYAESHGHAALYRELLRRDPERARRLHPHDVRRTVRALELHALQGRPMSQGYRWTFAGGRYRTVQLGLYVPRQALYERVHLRVDQMVLRGLQTEVAALLANGFNPRLTSMQAIGYKEMAAAVLGEWSLEQAVAAIKQATRRYVKRQLSWFMRDPRIVWHWQQDPTEPWQVDGFLKTITQLSGGFSQPRSE